MPEHGHGILEGAAVWSRHADLFARVVRLFCIPASCCALGAHIPGLVDFPNNPCINETARSVSFGSIPFSTA